VDEDIKYSKAANFVTTKRENSGVKVQIVFENDDRGSPQLSIVLLDWSCRESFHILDYLQKQTIPRTQYEVIWIEYYDRRASQIEQILRKSRTPGKAPVVDCWATMGVPNGTYYHKHLMYNLGIILSKGMIVAICDSDAILRETFVERIIGVFEPDSDIVLHLDQARNNDKRFYPFSYPTIEDVIGEGCINWYNGKTTGLWNTNDILHTRNYGACMAARREDLIAIGGADEHVDYLGHICGPYEMTFRLINAGKKELWHPTEFLYHVWHPGQAGQNNFVGPHDGRHVSSTALRAKFTGRILPFVENEAIRKLRLGNSQVPLEQSLADLVSEERLQSWSIENIAQLQPQLGRTLLSFRHRIVAFRLVRTFLGFLLKRVRKKIMQLGASERGIAEPSTSSSGEVFLSVARVNLFFRSSLEFFLSVIDRSRTCLNSVLAQGHREVSFYGTDDLAEILYDLSFELPVKIKSVYDDCEGERFHKFKVLPIEGCASNQEPIIVTGSAQIENKIKRLRTLGVSTDRVIVMV
jgi:hypothetical protein